MDAQKRAAYLARIGLGDRAIGAPGIELLDTLVKAHQLSVPFEDLDSYWFKRAVSLDSDDLFRKIVVEQRGGYCFEQNKLFEELLVSCGFKAWPVIARNVRNTTGALADELPPVMHRGEVVRIDEELRYVDVGYGGPMPACSIPVVDGARARSCGQEFQVVRLDDAWWQIAYRREGCDEADTFKPVVNFMVSPAQEGDFELMSYWCSNNAASPFVNNLILNRRTVGGNVYLRNKTLTRVDNGVKETYELTGDELQGVVERDFGIPIDLR